MQCNFEGRIGCKLLISTVIYVHKRLVAAFGLKSNSFFFLGISSKIFFALSMSIKVEKHAKDRKK